MNSTTSAILDNKLDREKNYWLDKLADALGATQLPLDHKRPAVFNAERESHTFRLGAETEARLRELCAGKETLAFAVLVAALKVCLHKYTGARDIIVGTSIHEHHGDTSALNRVLALRDRVDPAAGVRQLLEAVKTTLAEAYANQKFPFERAVELLNIERPVNRTPLFSVVAILDSDANRANVRQLMSDVTVVYDVKEEGTTCSIEYNPELFLRETVEVFGGHLQSVLLGMLSDTGAAVGGLDLLTAEKRREFIRDFNETEGDYPRLETIVGLFEAQAARTPDATAVADGQRRLTYSELNARSNQLARRLRARGVGPGRPVGICLEHSPETLVAILGVLKAGGCYVPLDPRHPSARLSFVFGDAAFDVLLTQQSLLERLPKGEALAVCLDADWDDIARESAENLPAAATAEDIAYIIYTSGSTGQPKGVCIRHSSLVNYVWWARKVYLQDEALDFPLYSALAFDLTVTSVFTPLITGSRVVVYRQQGREPALPDILRDNQVGVLKLTPSHLALIKDRDNSGSNIRRLIVGGEALETKLAAQVYESFGGRVEIFNEYGPTEATVGCMIYKFDFENERRAFVPIGRPAANTQIYILDEGLNPVAENITGELYISGDGLAAGYLNREALTAERFVENPFAAGRKMYKTGDLARRLPGGAVEYVGRRDEQVKVRGHRVELGEISGALTRHPQVGKSVVTVVKDSAGGDVMVAYYVARRELDPSQLRDFMAGSVVEETIPNLFVHLTRLPLTINGKVDLKALPTLEAAREKLKRAFVAPRNAVEEILAAAWCRMLGLGGVGVNDNFFTLGGHSLLVTQLVSHVRETFKVELPLRAVFESPTVAELARRIESAMSEASGPVAPPLRPMPRDGALPLSFAQQRLWFIDRLVPGSAFYNIANAVRLKGKLDVAALEQTLTEVTRRHESLRTFFPTLDGQPLQAIVPVRPFSLPVVDLSDVDAAMREEELARVLDEFAKRPFDLGDAPPLRAALVRLAEEEHAVLLTMHHIISDGWSMGVLTREVTTLYQAFSNGKPSPLPELPIQYADYAMWQRGWLQGEALEAELSYWRRQLAGAPPVLELPTDRPRPPVQTYRGASRAFQLPAEVAEALKELGRSEGATLYMTLLAAFKVLLSRYTGQEDVVVGTPSANRNRAETEDLIGFFVNTLVLRTDLSGEPTFREALRRVREVSLEAYTHENLPFEKVVQELNPERSQSHTPIVQVLFGFQKLSAETATASDLSMSALGSESGTARFDLTQNVFETERGLVGTLHYSADLFDGATAARMTEHFRRLLTSIASDPDRRTSEFELLSDAERRQLLGDWNETRADYPSHLGMHQLFERQARLTPDATAATCEGRSLTYRELNRRANRLARLLVERGVGGEVVVGLLAGRGLELLTAVLAVFKAGGAYLPLDPRSPARRLGQVLTQSATPLVLATAEHRRLLDEALASIHEGRRPEVLPFGDEADAAQDSADGLRDEDLHASGGPESLAYVIYTSGSTGVPKGAMVEQRGMVNHLFAKVRDLSLTAADSVAQTASQCFDISVWQMLAALVVGGRVEIFPDAVAHDARRLLAGVESAGVTIVETVPSLLRAMLDDGAGAGVALSSLRWMIPTGEALPPELCRRWLNAYGHAPLLNAYGPTECSDDVSHYAVRTPPADSVSNIPVGRPVQNMRLYVVDKQLRPVPVGVAGELCVGGVGVGRGYLGEPSRTAEVFVPDALGAEPGARLYRTGDLARYLPDGNIEFIGRIDHQVKVRGYRIELGEIEATLRQCEEIADAVVSAAEDAAGGRRLVAYVVANEGGVRVEELQGRLKERLPEYMVPSAFVLMEALPLSPNGKVDRKALPAPELAGAEWRRPFVAPRTPLELWLAEKWAAALNLDVQKIGVEDSFFDLGGDSISAAVIVNRVQDALREVVHVVTILDTPTVAGFAAFLEGRYAAAIARLLGGPEATPPSGREAEARGVVTPEKVERLRVLGAEARRRVAPLAGGKAFARGKVEPVAFVLSPPRSGSTLLRVILGGHTQLFAPPELELLGFRDMSQRRDALSGRDKFWLEGVVRAVMQLRGCSPEEAQSVVAEYEGRGASTTEFYAEMQRWLGAGKMLVDKSPSYALEAEVLGRAEEEFGASARYIHLVRRPEAMIHSYAEAQMDQIFPRFEHGFGVKELAELVWVVSQQNILGFLKNVEAGRQHRVMFEEMVTEPRRVTEELCEFLGVKFEEEMLEPYKERARRMTDGPKAESKMLGDVKFHGHSRIEPAAGERWRDAGTLKLGEVTRQLAAELGYASPEDESVAGAPAREAAGETGADSSVSTPPSSLKPIQTADTADEIPDVSLMSDEEVEALLASVL